MKPRKEALTIPTSDRYWDIVLEGKGQHHFRHPYYGVGAAVMVHLGKGAEPEEDISIQEKALKILPNAGLVIGACWHHRAFYLDSVFPKEINEESLKDYGNSVSEELQEAGYNLLQIIDLYGKCVPELLSRQSILKMAEDRATFSGAPKDVSMPS